MKIIISPAKKMKRYEYLEAHGTPMFLDRTKELSLVLKEKTIPELKKLYSASDKIVKECYDNFQSMDLEKNVSPALLSYDGIQFKYMMPEIFTQEEFDYCQKNVVILSGFYGYLKPFDGVVPYRLEMNNPLSFLQYRSLYQYWGDSLYQELYRNHEIVLNLCSEEYGKAVRRYVQPQDKFIEVLFFEEKNQTLSEKGVYCKMARGSMVRYLAENRIEDAEEVRCFTGLGYHFQESLSSENKFVFVRKPVEEEKELSQEKEMEL